MKLFLTSFALHNPDATAPLPSHAIIPVSVDTDAGVDLDYSSLLLAESFVIDGTAYEHIQDRQRTHLAPMAHTLRVLKTSGFLEIADYGAMLSPYREKIVTKASSLVEHVEPWLEITRRQWSSVEAEFKDFHQRYGTPSTAHVDTIHYGVACLLQKKGCLEDAGERDRLASLLRSRKTHLSTSERADMRGIIRPLVSEVVMNNLLRSLLGAPFLDWDDAQEFYNHLAIGHWTELDLKKEDAYDGAGLLSQSRCLFSVVIPELLPSRVEDVVEFIQNKRAISSLRTELWTLLRDGKPVSKDWMLALHAETTRAKIRSEKRGRIVKWVGRIAGCVVPGTSVVTELLADVAVAGAEEAAGHTWEKRPNAKFEWYYALQRIAMKKERAEE